MSIIITIEGNHPTDVLAELKVLSDALNNQPNQLELPKVKVEREVYQDSPKSQKIQMSEQNDSKSFGPNPFIDEPVEEKTKKLSRGEHKAEADKMIAAGERDDEIYSLLSRAQQKRVDEALAAPDNVEEKQEEVDKLFDDEPVEEAKPTITREDISELIIKKCRDENGKDIPEMYAAVRAELKNVVAKDQEPKISNVPESKYQELYNAINSLGK